MRAGKAGLLVKRGEFLDQAVSLRANSSAELIRSLCGPLFEAPFGAES